MKDVANIIHMRDLRDPNRLDVKMLEKETGKWVSARPCGYMGLCLGMRLKRAWMVFTGHADVLVWEGGQ